VNALSSGVLRQPNCVPYIRRANVNKDALARRKSFHQEFHQRHAGVQRKQLSLSGRTGDVYTIQTSGTEMLKESLRH
jgi:hypothetical protein